MSVSPAPARRWKCVCAYDGGPFAGWQSQTGGRAIQDVLQERLARIFHAPVRLQGSGRTDAGVHAHAQVFHFDAAWGHSPEKMLAAMRHRLTSAIQIKSVKPVGAKFHSRFSATGKRYTYHVHLGDAEPFERPYCWPVFRPLDFAAMQQAAAGLVGRHDFRTFTALNGTEREDTVRDLRRLDVVKRGPRIRVIAEADGFLYKMMRSLVGALVSVGEGKLTPERVMTMLTSRTRTAAILTAPPQGLFLDRVFYR